MVSITYVDSDNNVRVVDVAPGVSVMAGARANGVPEIESDCGGVCTCAACHVHVDPKWLEKTGVASKIEKGLLSLQETWQPNSRLSCQITISEELDGLVIRTLRPEEEWQDYSPGNDKP
ncbi:MAG: 2Fe-2S iron-sulfur cluster-binding protein [Porticoccaceae bacterium]|nr:2Fe-2S iron-sulfur cluster-binding protein [Porticoccaceae bacterium]